LKFTHAENAKLQTKQKEINMFKSTFEEDMARGCLENGEALEARWGSGEWSAMQDQRQIEPEPEPGDCPFCGKEAVFFGGEFYDCPNCKKNYADIVFPAGDELKDDAK
jgi:Zn finger protein HypA/HybF involved in hydrogenase expression